MYDKLFLIRPRGSRPKPLPKKIRLAQVGELPLILPSGPHGLRATLDVAFSGSRLPRLLPIEIDSLALVMDAVRAGLGCTIQPAAALARCADAAETFEVAEIADAKVRRLNSLCSLSDDELSPAALAVRVTLAECARALVEAGRWEGARLSHHEA